MVWRLRGFQTCPAGMSLMGGHIGTSRWRHSWELGCPGDSAPSSSPSQAGHSSSTCQRQTRGTHLPASSPSHRRQAPPTCARPRPHAPGPAHMRQAPPLRIHLGLAPAQRFVRTVSTSGQIKSPKGEPPQTGAGPLLWEGGRRFSGSGVGWEAIPQPYPWGSWGVPSFPRGCTPQVAGLGAGP